MYPKIDFNTRTWYKIVIIITCIARKQDVEATKNRTIWYWDELIKLYEEFYSCAQKSGLSPVV